LLRLLLLNTLLLFQGFLLWGQISQHPISLAKGSTSSSHVSIRLDPEGIVLEHPGASQRFIISAIDSDGVVKNVTQLCQVVSSAPDIAEIDLQNSRIVAGTPGQTEIRVSWNKAVQVSHVTVGNRPYDMGISFSPDILSILTTRAVTVLAVMARPPAKTASNCLCSVTTQKRTIR
jgi:hypothetical protein